MGEVAPELRRFILGDTDSEVIFFLFLTLLAERASLASKHELDSVSAALGRTVQRVRELASGGADPALLTLMVTDGELLAASEGGRSLFWSTYKKSCSDRERCSSLSAECESPTVSGNVNHFIVSSEPLQGENVWHPFDPGEIVAVDRGMRVHRAHVDRRGLPVLLTG
jgi:glutamine amidotransferase